MYLKVGFGKKTGPGNKVDQLRVSGLPRILLRAQPGLLHPIHCNFSCLLFSITYFMALGFADNIQRLFSMKLCDMAEYCYESVFIFQA